MRLPAGLFLLLLVLAPAHSAGSTDAALAKSWGALLGQFAACGASDDLVAAASVPAFADLLHRMGPEPGTASNSRLVAYRDAVRAAYNAAKSHPVTETQCREVVRTLTARTEHLNRSTAPKAEPSPTPRVPPAAGRVTLP